MKGTFITGVYGKDVKVPKKRTLGKKVTKAIIEAFVAKDFSHWMNTEEGYGPAYLLELGGGYRLVAKPPKRFFESPGEFLIIYDGEHCMFSFMADRYHLWENRLKLESVGGNVYLELSDDVDIQKYAKSVKRDGSKKNIVWKDDGERIELDAYRDDAPYWGDDSEWDQIPFDQSFKMRLIEVACLQRFSELEYDYGATSMNAVGPAEFRFRYIDDAKYCSDIDCTVSDDRGPISLWARGNLAWDGDGVAIRGIRAAYTVKISDEDLARFYEENPDIPTDARYLEEHPAVSYSHIIGDRMDKVLEILGTEDDSGEDD